MFVKKICQSSSLFFSAITEKREVGNVDMDVLVMSRLVMLICLSLNNSTLGLPSVADARP